MGLTNGVATPILSLKGVNLLKKIVDGMLIWAPTLELLKSRILKILERTNVRNL